jgi:2-polyprenyl-3-methyl-5-hydroxy-6-metoxy-1,4-benzoquinol methylase
MNSSALVKLIGFPATLVHGDTLVLDRWRWLKRRLPRTHNAERLIDIGCGTGAFSIGAALRGYDALGLSWDERNQRVAAERARLCGAATARFDVLDVRRLDERVDLVGQFDVAICCENIEHILDDRKLMRDMSACLKPGGRLLLTTPYLLYRHMGAGELGPFRPVEDGDHVRRGYSSAMLAELCGEAGLVLEQVSFCSGWTSQHVTKILRTLERVHPALAWGLTLPLRLAPPVMDPVLGSWSTWPSFSICMEAYKPRFSSAASTPVAGRWTPTPADRMRDAS